MMHEMLYHGAWCPQTVPIYVISRTVGILRKYICLEPSDRKIESTGDDSTYHSCKISYIEYQTKHTILSTADEAPSKYMGGHFVSQESQHRYLTTTTRSDPAFLKII